MKSIHDIARDMLKSHGKNALYFAEGYKSDHFSFGVAEQNAAYRHWEEVAKEIKRQAKESGIKQAY
jgi:hypothetical protein